MKAAPPLTSSSATPSCFTRVKESKLTDVTLLTGFVALLIIGILATVGLFQFMGTTNAAFLSYGMYGGAGLFLLAEVIKLAVAFCKKKSEANQIERDKKPVMRFDRNVFLKAEAEREQRAKDKQFVNEKIEKLAVNPNSSDFKHSCTITLADKREVTLKLEPREICALHSALTSSKCGWDEKFDTEASFSYKFQASGAYGVTARNVFDDVIQPAIDEL